jgi:hypothetical protein
MVEAPDSGKLDVGTFKVFLGVVNVGKELGDGELEDEVLEYKDLKCDVDGVIVEVPYGDKLDISGFKAFFDAIDVSEELGDEELEDK